MKSVLIFFIVLISLGSNAQSKKTIKVDKLGVIDFKSVNNDKVLFTEKMVKQ